ncbi:T9SS C-terminal target domain-containing protein [Niastella caeni]|uniref:T9SS C-terminal target domain-containing protein n=1 Tax=Niastella caeni TaxID=2569763 RepID=A0A4S8HZY3_9BACT|nr:T9SS C-terminal target domain-containing protein [Niastella caeni]THU41418.1 T9SS C-terminal target domain-containing protein [Niastella caeni]
MMIHTKFLTMLAVAAVLATGCTKSDDEDDDTTPAPTNTTLQGTLTENKTLTADKKWTLKGYVYVANGVTLTIEPGTVIVGDTAVKAALCVERGGKLMAEGTAAKPIVFTSGKAAGSRAPGDWGGVVLLGKAKTNRSATPVIEGGLDRPYGGTDDADNSGSLKYVRIEFAGIAAFAGSEINGLTLGGVGSGTTLENIQVSYGNDDGYEFFGGTVSGKRMITYACSDDDFDFDFGYTGKIQFGVVIKDPNTVDNGDDNNGIECDNDGSGTTATPYTKPNLSNFTFVGPNSASTNTRHKYGNRFRRATQFSLRNSIIMGYNAGGFVMESDATAQAYVAGTAVFKNNLVHAVANPYFTTSTGVITIADIKTKAESEGCNTFTNPADIKLTNPFNISAPDVTPASGSPALIGASFTGMDAFFESTGTFRGAVGTTNWLQGWTSFSPKTNTY